MLFAEGRCKSISVSDSDSDPDHRYLITYSVPFSVLELNQIV